jgi:hypothetical protein
VEAGAVKPYYEQGSITIHCGDARDLVGQVQVESIITDPIWPNSVFPGIDPKKLLGDVLAAANEAVERVVIHLGCDSDPRFLEAVPSRWPFLRVCWLDYARPSYKGRLLYGSDVAYVFGVPPAPRKGHHLMPGKCMAQRTGFKIQREIGGPTSDQKNYRRNKQLVDVQRAHPCPRRIQHVQWLVNHFAGASLVDPFCGSGTTILAAKEAGVRGVGIEIEERYCEIAVKRLAQGVLFQNEEREAVSA